jgi:hypothetical protein
MRVTDTRAHAALRDNRINPFEQHRISSFISRRPATFALVHQLKEETYHVYKQVWKQLLCFVYRLIHLRRQPAIPCTMTTTQTLALDQLIQVLTCCRLLRSCRVEDAVAGSLHCSSTGWFVSVLLKSSVCWYWVGTSIDRICIQVSVVDSVMVGSL